VAALNPLTRDRVPPDLQPLWDECERVYPDFRNLWATMAHSPVVFRHVWGQLLALKRESPVEARHFELAILVVSGLLRCRYCVSHHTPRALATGLTAEQLDRLAELRLGPLAETHDFPPVAGFDGDESLVIALAYFTVWAGVQAPANGVPPGTVHRLRRRLFERLHARFSPRQIEELVWRTAQCVAFNLHNDLLELDLESGVAAEHPAPERPAPARV
jgi:AhpD family alkylhydroperoxidase